MAGSISRRTVVIALAVSVAVILLILFLTQSDEGYSTPVAVKDRPMLSGYSMSHDYKVQHPRMQCPPRPAACGCGSFERDYPVWGIDKHGDQRMRVGGKLTGSRFDPMHTWSEKDQGNLNAGKYKLYGWRHSQYTGDPFNAHRWYNNPDTMQGHHPGDSIFKFDEECVFADESLPTAVARSTGYNDYIDNEGNDGNFQYPDAVGNQISNYHQLYDELA